jgi:predicted Co/Zn/Cd cation transporter (cation efflux family)
MRENPVILSYYQNSLIRSRILNYMARYICSYLVKVPLTELKPMLDEVLENCQFEVIYQTLDYIMGREIPGKVNFSKLVTVEVLIDSTTAREKEVQVNLVVKNDELPLQTNNHCSQIFERLQQILSEDHQWQLIAKVPV